MFSAFLWSLIYVVIANKLKLQCPHCQAKEVRGAGKIFVLGPLLRLRCSECHRKSRASFLQLPWNAVFAVAFLFVLINSNMKVNSRFLDIPSFVLMPAVLLVDMWVRFYVFRLKKA